MAGRPTSLTPPVQKQILTALRAGNYISVACSLAGITHATYCNWHNRAEAYETDPEKHPGNRPFYLFFEATGRAIAQGEMEALGKIHAASSKDWKAAAWFLGRRHRKRWGSETEPAQSATPPPYSRGAVVIRTTKRSDPA